MTRRSYGARGSGDPVRAQQRCDAWNELHPVGTRVAYWAVLPPREPALITTTRTAALEMCGTAVVWLEGKAGCVNLTHCEALSGVKEPGA